MDGRKLNEVRKLIKEETNTDNLYLIGVALSDRLSQLKSLALRAVIKEMLKHLKI